MFLLVGNEDGWVRVGVPYGGLVLFINVVVTLTD